MILEYKIANCLSFGEMTEFSMLASADKTRNADNTFMRDGLRFLKSAVIYGANGSGKTNFVNTFSYMRSLIIGNSSLEDRSFKLDKALKGKPSFFEVTFYNTDKKRYRYGFEINDKLIVSEWLFYTPSSREALLFTREGQHIKVGRMFKEGKGLPGKTKKTRLFLSVVDELNGAVSQSVVDWFRNVQVLSGLTSSYDDTARILEKKGEQYRRRVLEILQLFDIQIEDFILRERSLAALSIPTTSKIPESLKKMMKALSAFMEEEKITPSPQVITVRKVYEKGEEAGTVEFDLEQNESDGTRKLFALAGRLVEALDTGQTLIVDELESKLHPLITKEIVKIFNSKDKNKNNSQLIFTTHDTNLLRGGHLRRDQIWFTEKDAKGQSHLYSLVEYKEKPRKDASFEKDYIHGRYGAIPFIGDFTELLER